MTYIGVEVTPGELSSRFFNEVDKKLSDPNMFKNPFKDSKVHFFDERFYIVEMNVLFPNPAILFYIFSGIMLLFKWYIAAAILFGLAALFLFLFSPTFFGIMMHIGLKKKGYKGSFRIIHKREMISLLLKEREDHGAV